LAFRAHGFSIPDAMTHNQHARVNAGSKQYDPIPLARTVRIRNQTRELVGKNSFRFVKRNTMLFLI
jgi:hypothetical protein